MPTHDSINWLDFFEDDNFGRRSAFLSRRSEHAKTPGQKRAFGSLFDDAMDDYLERIGSAIRRGEAPTLTFDKSLDDFDFSDRLRRRTPLYSTPQGVTRPRVRLLFNPAYR